jgi:hypothetical protein
MTKAVTPNEALQNAWIQHEAAEALARGDAERESLLQARRAVAYQYPGCARAILSPDDASNWDRGSLVQEAKRQILNA